jgi:hypothetical protein
MSAINVLTPLPEPAEIDLRLLGLWLTGPALWHLKRLECRLKVGMADPVIVMAAHILKRTIDVRPPARLKGN